MIDVLVLSTWSALADHVCLGRGCRVALALSMACIPESPRIAAASARLWFCREPLCESLRPNTAARPWIVSSSTLLLSSFLLLPVFRCFSGRRCTAAARRLQHRRHLVERDVEEIQPQGPGKLVEGDCDVAQH
jgi:hypothetical protein